MNENELLKKAEIWSTSASPEKSIALTFIALTKLLMRVVDYCVPIHLVYSELDEEENGQS